MAATESPLGPEDGMRDVTTPETEFWDASFAWRGSKLAEPVSPLCSSYQSLLFRPACDPRTQRGSLTEAQFVIRRSVPRTSSSAINGCTICRLVMAAHFTISQYTTSVDRLNGFTLALGWSGGESNRFYRIDVFPIDDRGRHLCTHGYHNGIDLLLEGGKSRTTFCSYWQSLEYAEEVEQAIQYPGPGRAGARRGGAGAGRGGAGGGAGRP